MSTVDTQEITIDEDDFRALLAQHPGNNAFREKLNSADLRELFVIMGRYIYFNSVFGGGVANLAGELAARHDLFRDRDEEVHALSDRSCLVASLIFFAAVEEFGDVKVPSRFTHRALAQATLKGLAKHLGYSPREVDALVVPPWGIQKIVNNDVQGGYLLNRANTESELFSGLGFHIGSEMLADEEFRILDECLRGKHPDLVTLLKGMRVEVGDERLPAYSWIGIHTTAEAEHLKYAILSAKNALKYYAGANMPQEIKEWVLAGFRKFCQVQADFMNHILD